MNRLAAILCMTLSVWTAPSWAADGEILEVSGNAVLKKAFGGQVPAAKGELLYRGDRLETAEKATVDIAFDAQWNNTVRVEPATRVEIASGSPGPARLDLEAGGLYAKLKRLPEGSSFEVRTPTALAAVRGTEYRTRFTEGRTDVYNFSDSSVYVYGVSPGGAADSQPRVLERDVKLTVVTSGPQQPLPVSPEEAVEARELARGIEASVEQALAEGRQALLPTVEELEQAVQDALDQAKKPPRELEWDEMNVEAFSADMVLSGQQGTLMARFHASPGRSRMEMPGSVSIVRLDRGVVWVLMPSEKMFIEQAVTPEMSAQAMTGEGSVVSKADLGEELLDGRPARKYEVVLSSGSQTQTVYQWLVEGQVVPAKMQAVDGSWSVEYRNVRVGPQPDELFEVPADFTKMEMPTLPQNVGDLEAFQRAQEALEGQTH